MKVSFYTLGCKVNQYETQILREAFESRGYTVGKPDSSTDIFIVNSCTVTAESDRKTRQAVRHYKNICPNAVIVLCGCMAQAFPDDAENLKSADIITGNTNTSLIPDLVEEYLKDKKRILGVLPHVRDEAFSSDSIKNFDERTRAYIKIEDGCERYCTYCIIPKARGFVRSKPLEEIKSEAEALSKNGFSEIVLVGINLSAYGKGSDKNLADAVETVCSVDGIKRVRLGSLEPDHITNDILERFKNQEKFCPQFHLSLQSGCDKTLKRMNRHYDTAFYKDLTDRINSVFKDPSITTDMMVGFAGETEEDFIKSVEFLKEIGFAKTHVFAYSRREGTAAYSFGDQIDRKTKSERSRIMIEAAAECEEKFLKKYIGKKIEVLFETKENGFYFGYTKNYCRVKIKSDDALQNKIITVNVIGCEKENLIAEL